MKRMIAKAEDTLDTLFDDDVFATLEDGPEIMTAGQIIERAQDVALIAAAFQTGGYPETILESISDMWASFSRTQGYRWISPKEYDADSIVTIVIGQIAGSLKFD